MTRSLSLLLFAVLLVACGPSGTEVESSDAVDAGNMEAATATYAIDAEASTVEWEGAKLVGKSHVGLIPITDGTLEVSGDELVGGTITLDIAGLTDTDLDGEGKMKLEGHLKSGDFFDVEKYPTATFEITKVTPADGDHSHNVTGNLTLKGSSRSITIPADVSMTGNEIKATTPDFLIDRTEWGMEYGSGSIAGIAQDNIINDEVGLNLSVVARK